MHENTQTEDIYNTGLIPLNPGEIRLSRKSKAAKVISDVFSPPVMGGGGVILTAAEMALPHIWLWASLLLFLTVGVPTAYVFWLVRKGKVSDFHNPIRRQRVKPMIVITAMGLCASGILLTLHLPAIYLGSMLIGLGQVIIQSLITLKWKISGHAIAVSSFCVLCGIFLGAFAWFTFLLVPIVIWSRLRLRRHTLMQTAAGTLLGLTMLLVFLF
jgi:membrane-associated phospholipid phosphatase